MSEQVARRFIAALEQLEQSRELDPIVETFAESADVGNVLVPERFSGKDGARQFWTDYRGVFGAVRSTFRNVITTDGRAALEWTTDGTSTDGKPFHYEGVSVLELEDDLITRFHAYFDPAALGRQITD